MDANHRFCDSIGDKNGLLQKDVQAPHIQKDIQKDVQAQVVTSMTRVTITETYDLSTEIDKITLIGVHTPPKNLFNRHYSGLIANHKKARIVGADIKIACASMMPADPLQVGVEAGDIAPQDMFNPILYTAVSNDGFNNILNRIYNDSLNTDFGQSAVEQEISESRQGQFVVNAYDMYYGLLSWEGHFRKTMPQVGLEMRGLYPICYEVINNYGNQKGTTNNYINYRVPASDVGTPVDNPSGAVTFRGNAVRMPAIPLHTANVSSSDPNGWFPTTYVACIVMPPAKLHKLFYRMSIRWTVEFLEVISTNDYDNFVQLGFTGQASYATDYVFQSSKMAHTTDSVDVQGGNITKVMTSA